MDMALVSIYIDELTLLAVIQETKTMQSSAERCLIILKMYHTTFIY